MRRTALGPCRARASTNFRRRCPRCLRYLWPHAPRVTLLQQRKAAEPSPDNNDRARAGRWDAAPGIDAAHWTGSAEDVDLRRGKPKATGVGVCRRRPSARKPRNGVETTSATVPGVWSLLPSFDVKALVHGPSDSRFGPSDPSHRQFCVLMRAALLAEQYRNWGHGPLHSQAPGPPAWNWYSASANLSPATVRRVVPRAESHVVRKEMMTFVSVRSQAAGPVETSAPTANPPRTGKRTVNARGASASSARCLLEPPISGRHNPTRTGCRRRGVRRRWRGHASKVFNPRSAAAYVENRLRVESALAAMLDPAAALPGGRAGIAVTQPEDLFAGRPARRYATAMNASFLMDGLTRYPAGPLGTAHLAPVAL
jgi:hypothetical protein